MQAAPFYVFYVFAIGFVAAVLFVAVDGCEPNRWHAVVFKFLILAGGATAIANKFLP
jgi:hypothetical protein